MKIKLINRFLWLLVVFGGLFQSQLFAKAAINSGVNGPDLLSSDNIKPEVSFLLRANATDETAYEYMGHPYMGCNIPYKSINDANGNLYITGGSSEVGAPSGSMVVIKVDTDGKMVWEKRLPVKNFVVEMGLAITLDSEENPIASGIYWNGDNMDIQTMKLNKTNGEIIWKNVFDGGHKGMDVPKVIMVDKDNNVIVGGFSYGGKHISYLTLKYSSAGEQLWYDIDPIDGITESVKIEPNAMDIDKDGNIVIAGYGTSSEYYKVYYTIKYSANGTKLWKKDYLYETEFYQTNSEIFDVKLDGNGNCYVTGRLDTYGGQIGTIKYNVSGEQEWLKIYKLDDGYIETVAMQIVSDKVYVLGGYIQGFSDGGITLISYNTDGQENWVKETNDAVNINNVQLSVDTNGSLIALIRATDVNGVDSFYNNKFWARKYSTNGNIEKEVITSRQQTSTYSLYNIVGMGMDKNENVYVTFYSFYTSDGAVFEYLKMPFGSGEINPEWIKRYASPTGGSNTIMFNSLGDNKGNTYVVGTFALIQEEQFVSAYYLAKYNEQGKMEWKKDYTPTSEGISSEGIKLTLNKNGEPIICLIPESFSGGPFALRSYSSSGDLKWKTEKQLASSHAMITDNNNNLYIAAGASGGKISILKYSDGGVEEEIKYITPKEAASTYTITGAAVNGKGNIVWIGASGSNMMAVEITLEHELIWFAEVATNGFTTSALDLCIDNEDNVFLTGYLGNYQQVIVAKVDNAGKEIWKKAYDQGDRRVRPYKILLSGENGLIVSTYSNSFVLGNNRIVVLKYDKDGNFKWDFNTEFDHYYYGMYVDEKENTYILSQLQASTFPKRMYYSVSPMTYAGLLKIGADGKLIKTDAFAGPQLSSYFPRTLVAQPKGKLLVCGDVNNELSYYSGLYFFETTYEYNSGGGTSYKNVLAEGKHLGQNYPNPARDFTYIPFSLESNEQVISKIYNVEGKIVQTVTTLQLNAGEHTLKLDVSDLSPGIYFYELQTNSFREMKKIIIK